MSSAAAVTDASFEQDVLKSDVPVLVDFWAKWCAPCKKMKPMLDEIEKEYAGKVIVHRINVDENQELAKAMNVEILPTLKIFKGGSEIWTQKGVVEKSEIIKGLQ